MQNSFRWSLSLLPCLVALALLPARFAKADTISVFDVSGSAENTSGGSVGSCANNATCPFSGTLTVNVTTGTVDAIDITFPGLSAFNILAASHPSPPPPGWEIDADNTPFPTDELDLSFTTTPTPGSLVGFTGGTINGDFVETFIPTPLYESLTGTITPVPEPSSLGILAVALLGFAGIIGLRQGVFRAI